MNEAVLEVYDGFSSTALIFSPISGEILKNTFCCQCPICHPEIF